jgi:hypothetical protein
MDLSTLVDQALAARRFKPEPIPKEASVAWYELQAALATRLAEQARERASHRHAEVQAWVQTLEARKS